MASRTDGHRTGLKLLLAVAAVALLSAAATVSATQRWSKKATEHVQLKSGAVHPVAKSAPKHKATLKDFSRRVPLKINKNKPRKSHELL